MRPYRTLTSSLFILSLLFWPALALADWQAGYDAYEQGDYATALKEWHPLAKQGHAKAQFGLGVLYDRGEGVPQDYAQAAKWFRLAAEQGEALAQFGLGIRYRTGKGVPQDYAQAAKWTRLAAEQGEALAQFGLGIMYQYGKGVPQDYAQAHMWYNLAAAQGNKPASSNRDLIAEIMTPFQIADAQRLAREWRAK